MNKFKMMTVKDVADSFNITVRAVQKWIRKGYLPGLKLDNNQWRVLVNDYDKYVLEKLTRYKRLITAGASVFKKKVLDKYKKPPYYRHDEAYHGHVGLRADYFKSPDKRTKKDFVEVLYQKVRDEKSGFLVAVQPKELKKISSRELAHWYKYKV